MAPGMHSRRPGHRIHDDKRPVPAHAFSKVIQGKKMAERDITRVNGTGLLFLLQKSVN
jgi:hypothetical protein